MNKQEFIQAIECMGFEWQLRNFYKFKKITVSLHPFSTITINRETPSLWVEIKDYDKALKLINMILAGEL